MCDNAKCKSVCFTFSSRDNVYHTVNFNACIHFITFGHLITALQRLGVEVKVLRTSDCRFTREEMNVNVFVCETFPEILEYPSFKFDFIVPLIFE